jgi:CheY-like chemotaxis protein
MRTILIVEDEKLLLDSYKEIIEKAGHMCIGVSDGYQALDYLASHKDTVDLVLLDLMMPGVDGLEVLGAIKKNEFKYGTPPIIVLSNMTSDTVIQDAFELGVSSYLVKLDLDYNGLVKELDKYLVND